jgi:hypothetical protein
MISIYKTKIQPRLTHYDKEKIDEAFSRFREKQVQKEKELMKAAGIKSDLN